jgi:hypothetical protein
MATWQSTSEFMLRTMLNDAGCSSTTYSPERLEQLLITAAYFLPNEVNFNTAYTINVEASTISPNPINETDDGTDFISFMVLKAACMVDEGNFRSAALLQGVKARCGPAVLETSSHGQYLMSLLLHGPCKTFLTLKEEYNFGYDGSRILRAVMSPFVSNTFTPNQNNNIHRGR